MKGVWLLGVVIFWARGSLGAEPSGSEILEKSQAAYAALKSYVGTTTVKSRAVISGMSLAQTATAQIVFLRPGKIRIEGRDASGNPFVVVSDGKASWRSWALKDKGVFEKTENLETAIAAMTGVAAGSATTIPAALVGLSWGSPWAGAERAKLTRRERIGGVECYRVASETPIGRTTYWVDAGSFLLRQIREEQDAKQLWRLHQSLEGLTAQAPRARGIEPPQVTMKSRETIHSFRIDRVDAPIDVKLFQDPTKTPDR